MHPILDSLVGTENEWIKNMLFACNAGDIAQFDSILPTISESVRRPSSLPLRRC